MTTPIQFYFDFSSPYAYLGATQIEAVAFRHGRTVEWRPILLGAIFKITGMRPGPDMPMRGDYMKHDAARFARLLGIPFRWPGTFPVSGVTPSRAVYWAQEHAPEKTGALCRALLSGFFAHDVDPSTEAGIVRAARAVGLDGATVFAGTQEPAVKDRLKAAVDAAIDRGVFGSPFTVIDGEGFWGADRLTQVEQWLEGKGR
jgi:2-hydroxychromene-2-carboxylate isomerase